MGIHVFHHSSSADNATNLQIEIQLNHSIWAWRFALVALLCASSLLLLRSWKRGFFKVVGENLGALLFGSGDVDVPNHEDLTVSNDPLSDVVLRFPSHAAWFIKSTMLFGALLGFFLSVPVFVYLHYQWTACGGCPRPLRWWLAINSTVQGLQSLLRLCFYFRLNHLALPQHSVSATEQEVPFFQRRSNSEMIARRRELRRTRRRELVQLSRGITQLTTSPAWSFSLCLAVIGYGLFLIGMVWAAVGQKCCCGTCGGQEWWSVWDPEEETFKFQWPNIQLVTIIVIVASVARIVIVMFLFYVSVPSRLYSDSNSFVHSSRSFVSEAQFRDAFATFNSVPDTHWVRDLAPGTDELMDLGLYRNPRGVFLDSDSDNEALQPQQRRKGLTLVEIQRLPVIYFSSLVFPNALKSADSRKRVLAKFEKMAGVGGAGVGNMEDGCPNTQSLNFIESGLGTKEDPIILNEQDSPKGIKETPESQKSLKKGFRFCFPKLMGHRPETPPSLTRRRLTHARSPDQTARLNSPRTPDLRTPDTLTSAGSASPSFLPSWRRLQWFRSNPPVPTPNTTVPTSIEWSAELFDGPPLFFASCSICLDDFDEGCELRQLPCRHGFHQKCIDTWLMQVDSCPMCHASAKRSWCFSLCG